MQWWCAAQGVTWTWEWQAYPGVWLFLLLVAGGWAHLLRKAGAFPAPRARTASFAGGIVVLWLALDWPVGALGAGYLASVHMVQFLLIALLAPPLLLLGTPPEAYHRLARARSIRLLRPLTHPLASIGLFTAVLGLTHWPTFVDALMASQAGSFLLDMLWLGAGVLFWWPVAAPRPERAWFGLPAKMGYLIVATVVNTGVFAFLTFSELPVYATYELAPPVSGLSSRDDQRLAGLLMKMGGAVILWTSISILFFRWWIESERDETEIPDARKRGGVAGPPASVPPGAPGGV